MLLYLQLDCLSKSENERMNFFLEKIHQSYFVLKKRYTDNECIYKYFTKNELRTILGSNKDKIISLLLERNIISKILKKDRHGNYSNMFSLSCQMKSKKYTPSDKRFLKSKSLYYKSIEAEASSKVKMIASNMRLFKIDITREEFLQWASSGAVNSSESLESKYFIWEYIQSFNSCRGREIYSFITEDKFSGRIHTPFTSLPSGLRKYIVHKDFGKVKSLDLTAAQPNILAHILDEEDSNNEFSKAFFESDDIYIDLQEKLRLKTRDEAKKEFYRSVFGDGSSDSCLEFGRMYPRSAELIWKMRFMNIPENPSIKKHSNVAWLLQNKETEIFSEVWKRLHNDGISFLTIHDQIYFPKKDFKAAQKICNEVASKFLKKFYFKSK